MSDERGRNGGPPEDDAELAELRRLAERVRPGDVAWEPPPPGLWERIQAEIADEPAPAGPRPRRGARRPPPRPLGRAGRRRGAGRASSSSARWSPSAAATATTSWWPRRRWSASARPARAGPSCWRTTGSTSCALETDGSAGRRRLPRAVADRPQRHEDGVARTAAPRRRLRPPARCRPVRVPHRRHLGRARRRRPRPLRQQPPARHPPPLPPECFLHRGVSCGASPHQTPVRQQTLGCNPAPRGGSVGPAGRRHQSAVPGPPLNGPTTFSVIHPP